jgi:hypothetical protein
MRKVAIAGLVTVMLAAQALASTNAADQADDAGYGGGWTNGATGADAGFGPWVLSVTSNDLARNGFFVGDSTGNGFGADGTDINTAGKAWGLYSNLGQTAAGVRPLAGGPLAPGQAIEFRMDNGLIEAGAVGAGLQNAQAQNVWEVFFRGGQAYYEYVDASGMQLSTIPFTDDGIVVTVRLTSYNTYVAKISEVEGTNVMNITGTLMMPYGGSIVSQLRVFSYDVGEGGDHDAYFNALTVDAAPAVSALPDPAISVIAHATGSVTVTWPATNMAYYDLETTTNLVTGPWGDVPGATGLVPLSNTLSVVQAPGDFAFYRIQQNP